MSLWKRNKSCSESNTRLSSDGFGQQMGNFEKKTLQIATLERKPTLSSHVIIDVWWVRPFKYLFSAAFVLTRNCFVTLIWIVKIEYTKQKRGPRSQMKSLWTFSINTIRKCDQYMECVGCRASFTILFSLPIWVLPNSFRLIDKMAQLVGSALWDVLLPPLWCWPIKSPLFLLWESPPSIQIDNTDAAWISGKLWSMLFVPQFHACDTRLISTKYPTLKGLMIYKYYFIYARRTNQSRGCTPWQTLANH